jgi:hypothetical protein
VSGCSRALGSHFESVIALRTSSSRNDAIREVIAAWRSQQAFVTSYQFFSNKGMTASVDNDNCWHYLAGEWNDLSVRRRDCSDRWQSERRDYDLFTASDLDDSVLRAFPPDDKCGRVDYARIRCRYRQSVLSNIQDVIAMYDGRILPLVEPRISLNCLQCVGNQQDITGQSVVQIIKCFQNIESDTTSVPSKGETNTPSRGQTNTPQVAERPSATAGVPAVIALAGLPILAGLYFYAS